VNTITRLCIRIVIEAEVSSLVKKSKTQIKKIYKNTVHDDLSLVSSSDIACRLTKEHEILTESGCSILNCEDMIRDSEVDCCDLSKISSKEDYWKIFYDETARLSFHQITSLSLVNICHSKDSHSISSLSVHEHRIRYKRCEEEFILSLLLKILHGKLQCPEIS